MNSTSQLRRESFALSLPKVLLLGVLASSVFLGLIATGPIDSSLLRRYCLNHPVAIACVCLFFVGIISLSLKWYAAIVQVRWTRKAATALRRLTADGQDIRLNHRAPWLEAHWKSLPQAMRHSWLGLRLMAVVQLQVSRGRRHQLESDLQSLAEAEVDRQHESYSLLRIINWAMPMLGFLGTVLGISQTLGQLDTQLLATQQQEAMNELTAGLYVAFDTTAIALILTVFLMFVQFAVSRFELNLLSNVHAESTQELVTFLGADPYDAQATLLAPVRDMATDLVEAVRQLTENQATIWNRSIAESQQQWADWTIAAAENIESGMGDTIAAALDRHVTSLRELTEVATGHLDSRWQQWQTTLSEQARVIQSQQKELAQQTMTLQSLVDSTNSLIESTVDLRKLEEVIQESVSRLENLGRLEEATLCMGEAVTVLATSLERAGIIRGMPVKPRTSRVGTPEALGDRVDPLSNPQQRKAA